jgi:hypothetical protein
MDFEQLRQKLKDAGVLAMRVEGNASDENAEGFTASGTLDDYTEVLKTLLVSVVYVFTESIEAEDFQYQLVEDASDEDHEDQEDGEGIDLCKVDPELQKFRSHIGQIGAFRLCAFPPSYQLNFFIRETWYEEFLDCMNEAARIVDERRNAAAADVDAQEETKAKKLLESIHELINDAAFVRLPTQKAMLAYAIEHITGLGDLDRQIVKEAIQDVRARMDAKGFLRSK